MFVDRPGLYFAMTTDGVFCTLLSTFQFALRLEGCFRFQKISHFLNTEGETILINVYRR